MASEEPSDLGTVTVERRANGALEVAVDTTASSGCYDVGAFELVGVADDLLELRANIAFFDGPCIQSIVTLRFETVIAPEAIGAATIVSVTLLDEQSGKATILPPVLVPK